MKHTFYRELALETRTALFALVGIFGLAVIPLARAGEIDALSWPPITRECRPWAYNWWLGSAVDATNLTKELTRYRDAGLGGIHIIPIYGAKGWEQNYLPYLSPKWMEMLRHAVTEGQRLDLGVDMTTGTGWCFGGPTVSAQDANASVVVKTFDVNAGERLRNTFDRKTCQALVAYPAQGNPVDLMDKIAADGSVDWIAGSGRWRIYAVSQRPSGQRVKRAAPGGEGYMLNLIYASAMPRYLERFTDAFAHYSGPKPRAMYHDSYEYRSDWAPDFFDQFQKHHGYRLQDELPALFGREENEHVARVKCDYRETISDIMVEESLPAWVRWCHEHGFITRNQAHGSPGNLLDLYATADIPETEMFHTDRNRLVSKCASSAAHVTGKRLVSSETGTWLQEHFTETLADMKYLLDDLFLSGVNHVFYHGTCYSPDEAPWPGWLFYASFEMNPRNSIWHDVPALNAYAARCQAVLQSGQSDNDILLYWPIHDRWQNPKGRMQNFSVHARNWLEDQPFGKAAARLWSRGFAFDYVSDRQLAAAQIASGRIQTIGGGYRVVVVPSCELMPVTTCAKLLALAKAGGTVIFEQYLPKDVPGFGNLEQRRAEFRRLLASVTLRSSDAKGTRQASVGDGRILVGDLEPALRLAGVARETLTDHASLMFVRRSFDGGRHYFVANRGNQPLDGWITLATSARSIVAMDPLTARTGLARIRPGTKGETQVYLQLGPGESVILRAFTDKDATGPDWPIRKVVGKPSTITGTWQVHFISGGPLLPPDFQTATLASWTELGGDEAKRFAGTARYALRFDAPSQSARQWVLDLGQVKQSARVRLNGRDLGTVFIPPFRVLVSDLKPKDNLLEVEATNVSANRIRDLDRRKVAWKNFHDINFVNLNYKPFNAADWPLTESGLLGPVTLVPVAMKTF